jgi:hypothetical protein
MAKGNHVFNAFDKVIAKIYGDVVLLDDPKRGREFDALGGSGGDVVEADTSFNTRFESSYKYFKEIRDHVSIGLIHKTQDDRPVVANDANSKDFGEEAIKFGAAVMKWATGASNDDPMDVWRQLINMGSDPLAQTTYIKQGSSEAGTPGTEDARRARCVELDKFIKGELTKLVRNWLLAIRWDLKKLRKVSYIPSQSSDWKDLLKA